MKIYPADFDCIIIESNGEINVTLESAFWGLTCRPEYKSPVIITKTNGWLIEIWFFKNKKSVEQFKNQVGENTEIIWEGNMED